MSVELDSLLTHSPEVRHDRVRIAGTGNHRPPRRRPHEPQPPTRGVVRKCKHLTPAGVHAALAYYHADREQIDAGLAADREEAARLEADFARSLEVA